MAEELLVSEVRSQSIGVAGRCLNSARTNHFVIDDPHYNGGPGEEITPPEAFLAGISGCGVLLVEKFAAQDGIALGKVVCTIQGIRTAADRANFREIRLKFEIAGADPARAEALVERYRAR